MPTFRPTQSGLQTKGTLWAGFDPQTSAIVAGVFIASVMVTFALISHYHANWVLALGVCFLLPNGATLAVIFLLVMGKPPRYLRDWGETHVLGRTYTRLDQVLEPEASPVEE